MSTSINRNRKFARAMRVARSKAKVSQREFALRLRVSLRTYQKWEQGVREPSNRALRNMWVDAAVKLVAACTL